MKLHLDHSAAILITACVDDHVLIRGARYGESLIVLPDEIEVGWAASFDALAPAHFDDLLIRAPEVVLLGAGARQRFPSPALYRALIAARIGVEVMTTPAACRTYNILAAEGRRVAAALLFS